MFINRKKTEKMKKVTRIIGLMSMAAVLAVGSMSCKKNDTTNASFTFATPTVEGFSTGDAKAYIDPMDGQKMKWYEGDQMMIYNLDASNPGNSIAEVFTATPGCQGQTLTTFTGNSLGAKKDGGFFAFYPADKADLSKLNQNRGRWSVGDTQTFDPTLQIGGAGWENRFYMDPRGVVMAEIANDFMTAGSTMIMRHIFGFVNLRVACRNNTYSKQVKRITIRDKQVNLTGPIELNILELTEERLAYVQGLGDQYFNGEIDLATYTANLQSKLGEMGYTSEPNGYEVSLACPDGFDYITINDVKKYCIMALRPGALVNGFDVIVTYVDDTTETKSYEGHNYIVRPGKFVNVDVVL